MTNEEKRQALALLTQAIEAMDAEKQQFLLGYIAGVTACTQTTKDAG